MIVYVTRPDNHELVMGGWRSVRVWVEKPDFYHTPDAGKYDPLRSENPAARFRDIGWAVEHEPRSLRFKPLTKQDPVLEQNAWALTAWSACPRGVTFEDWEDWADQTDAPGEEFAYSNWQNLMWHRTRDSDLASNVHHKRFLMEVNLRTNECKLVVPKVHIYHVGQPLHNVTSHETIETQDISIELATRTLYKCPELADDIPF